MKKIFILLISIFVLTACGNGYTTINDQTAMNLINEGAIIVDVRTAEEYNEGHIANSINIPVDTINTISYDKEDKIIVYCASGARSANAAKELVAQGYTNIYNLDGGLINWGYGTE